MDKELKYMFGRLLGEVYKIQNIVSGSEYNPKSTIYGLINGLEVVIDEELEKAEFVSSDFYKTLSTALNEINEDPKRRNEFKGYYDIENTLGWQHEQRGKASVVLTYMKSTGRFVELINKMDSADSPDEMRDFSPKS